MWRHNWLPPRRGWSSGLSVGAILLLMWMIREGRGGTRCHPFLPGAPGHRDPRVGCCSTNACVASVLGIGITVAGVYLVLRKSPRRPAG